MKKISNEQWQFPQNDPRVAIGAKVARITRGHVEEIGTITKLTATQLQVEGVHPNLYYRATGYPVDRAKVGHIQLAADKHFAEFEQYKAEQQQRQAEIAEREVAKARNTKANLRRFAALIRAAGSDEAAMEHLGCFASNADVYGLGAEWPESESSNGA